MSGEDVLRELCRLTAREADPGLMAGATAATISRNLLERDPDATIRRVVARLGELASVGLASRGAFVRRGGRIRTSRFDVWTATPRGREVDAILDRITPARGGAFVPRTDAGLSVHESISLRRMTYRERAA